MSCKLLRRLCNLAASFALILSIDVHAETKIALVADWNTSYQRPSSLKRSAQADFIKKSYKPRDISTSTALIQQLDGLAQDPDLKSGDKVILMFSTHGVSKPSSKKTFHAVNLEDGQFDIERIRPYLVQLAKRGVDLGILDFSCHSRPSLSFAQDPLLQSNVCVITGDAVGGVSTSGFATNFLTLAQPGMSLEEVYLLSRKSQDWGEMGIPGISTSEHDRASAAITDLQKIISFSDWTNYQEFSLNLKAIPDCQMTDPEKGQDQLSTMLDAVSKIGEQIYLSDPEIAAAYDAYRRYRSRVEQSFDEHPGLSQLVAKTARVGDVDVPLLEIADPDHHRYRRPLIENVRRLPGPTEALLTKLLMAIDEGDRSSMEIALKLLPGTEFDRRSIAKKSDFLFQLTRKNAEFSEKDPVNADLLNRYTSPMKTAGIRELMDLAKIEYRLYNTIYSAILNQENVNPNNACRRFKI